MSRQNEITVEAFERGYRVSEEGKAVSPSGRIRKTHPTKNGGHLRFSFNSKLGSRSVMVHKLAAFQKFGHDFLKAECVRHLDNDETNNALHNIVLGTLTDNAMDQPKKIRKRRASNAAKRLRRLTDEKVEQLRADRESGMTYKELMAKYGIAIGTVSYIVNRKTYRL